MDSEWQRFFNSHDDPVYWEFPKGFALDQERTRAAEFAFELGRRLGLELDFESGTSIQDASFHSQIQLGTGWLRFSNFGRMVAFTPDAEVPQEARSVVEGLAQERGYRYVPTDVLEQPYTGRNQGVTGVATWWIRFFDWA